MTRGLESVPELAIESCVGPKFFHAKLGKPPRDAHVHGMWGLPGPQTLTYLPSPLGCCGENHKPRCGRATLPRAPGHPCLHPLCICGRAMEMQEEF